ncbi:MAG: FAD/NAD(P)-binding protein [Patescibacteria group bacterium]
MQNPYSSKPTTITNIKDEATDIRLFQLAGGVNFEHGQFMMVGIPGYGEAPFDVCSDNREKRYLEVCIRKAGDLTEKIFTLAVGDKLDLRGPYGHGFPPLAKLPTKNVLMLGGGTGFITLRSIIKEFIRNRKLDEFDVQVYYGARNRSCLLFTDEYADWQKRVKLNLVLEKKEVGLSCDIGLITDLFTLKQPRNKNLTVIMCGPPVMYKFALQKVKALGVPDENIFLSLERRMFCGQGVCEHCGVGPKYVCKDGPVFTYAEAKMLPGAF